MIEYKEIVDQIIEGLSERKTWIRPWKEQPYVYTSHGGGGSRNLITNRPYKGFNALITSLSKYESPYWVTQRQAEKIGGTVSGKPTMVVFYLFYKDGDGDKRGFAGKHLIYNVEQCIGLKHKRLLENKPKLKKVIDSNIPFNENLTAEQLIKNYKEMPRIVYGGGTGSYVPTLDIINILNKHEYKSEDYFYATLFHEIIHSTGHQKRLKRKGVMNSNMFGSKTYSEEELVAEIGNAFLCNYCMIDQLENSSAYVNSWITVLNNDPKMVVKAASEAQKAVDYVIKRSIELRLNKVFVKKIETEIKKITVYN